MDRRTLINSVLSKYRMFQPEHQALVFESALKSMSDTNLIGLAKNLGVYPQPDVFEAIFPNGHRIAEVE